MSWPVDTQPYGMTFRSNPSLFQMVSMIRSSCNVSKSCRRSSPDLKRVTKLGAPSSLFSNSSHRGTFLELIALAFSVTIPLHIH